jgi:hypothetical protein
VPITLGQAGALVFRVRRTPVRHHVVKFDKFLLFIAFNDGKAKAHAREIALFFVRQLVPGARNAILAFNSEFVRQIHLNG